MKQIEQSRSKVNMIGAIVGTVVGVVAVSGIVGALIYYIFTRNIKRGAEKKREQSD